MAIMVNNSAFTTSVLFNLKDVGMNLERYHYLNTTTLSEKYICVRKSDSVVIIDVTKPEQPIRLPIRANSAIMNPADSAILALEVQAKIDGTTQDQLQIVDVEANTMLKSYTIAEKVKLWKWITPKLLVVITHKAIYHWSVEGSTGLVKMCDMSTDELATHKYVNISDYMHDPSGKWFALIGVLKDRYNHTQLFVRPCEGGDQWMTFPADVAAFTTFNVVEKHTPATVLCYAVEISHDGGKKYTLELNVTDAPLGKPGEPSFGNKKSTVSSNKSMRPVALQISPKYGLIYVITQTGQIFIYDLETAQAICSYHVNDYCISQAIEGPTSGSFYSINCKGQVLHTNVKDSTILSFLSDKNTDLINLNTLLIKNHTELIKEKDKIVENLSKSLQDEQDSMRKTEQQLKSKKIEIDNYQKSQEEMMNKIEDFRLLKESNNLKINFTEYSHAELRKVTNDFNDLLKIGEGGYGPVYKAFIGLKPVAIKILKHESNHGNKQFSQEVEILSKVRHPNLVMLFGACQEAQALIYELLPNGSLYDIFQNEQTRNALTSKIRINIASNICSALIVLHSVKPHGIVHGDLKLANILLDSNYMGKLSDFGISRYLEKTDSRNTAHYCTNTLKGTFPYMDQEYFNLGEMTVEYDVYAFGIILLELVTGRGPRGLRDQVEEALNKGEIFVDVSAGEWPLEEAKKMVQLGLRCTETSRKNRPNLAKEVCPEIESMLHASLRF